MTPSARQFREMPLVGRGGVVEYLLRGLREPGNSYVLAGSAGIGKSRLAAEVAGAATERGLASHHLAATREAASIPFGAFMGLMPDIVEPPGGLTAVLRQAMDAVFERASPDGRLLIVIDDAHLLDDGSAALVHQLAKHSGCNLLATIRSPAPTPAPDAITALWKDDLAERVDIDALSPGAVHDLLGALLGGQLTDAGVRWLWEVTAGNPLFLREVMIAALDCGALREVESVWTLRPSLPLAPRLAELVAARLSGLGQDTTDAVDLVALGEPLPLEVLGAIVPEEAVESAETQGIIRIEDADGRLEARMDHPIFGEVRRKEIRPARMRRLCTSLAQALGERQDQRPLDELRIASWQLAAGLPGDPALLGRAAMAARHMFDLDLATRLARASLDAGGGIDAGLALAEADFFSGRPEHAEEVLTALEPQCTTDQEVARVANARAYNLGILLGDHKAALEVLEKALAAVSEPGARFVLLARRANIEVWTERTSAVLTDALELIASGDETAVIKGSYVAAIALAMTGRGDEAVEVARLGAETERRSTGKANPTGHGVGAVVGLLHSGRLLEAEEQATRAYDAFAGMNAQEALATYALLRGWIGVEQGRLRVAARHFREGVAINRDLRDESTLRWCLGGLALATGMAGDARAAASAISELDQVAPHWMDLLDPDLVLRGRAWARAAGGELSAARADLRRAVAIASTRRQPYTEARLLHDLARLGEPEDAASRLLELSADVEGALVSTFALNADALARRSAADLERTAETFEEMNALGHAAETLHVASLAFDKVGQRRAANACALRSAELGERCGGIGLLGSAPGSTSARLTRRESEIAALAATGLSSPEIGERLYISARTVENHLAKVYLKMGVNGRQALAAALRTS